MIKPFFEEINKEKMSEELGPAISSQLAEVAMKYWSEECSGE